MKDGNGGMPDPSSTNNWKAEGSGAEGKSGQFGGTKGV